MKGPEWDDYLLNERRDFIDDKDALAAFDFLVNAAIRLPDFECRPALQGAAKTFSYKNITSKSRDFAFIVNRKHLRFYVRPSGLKWVPGGFKGLKNQFNDAKETAGEWVVDIRSAPEAARLHSFLFRSAFVEFESQSTTVDNAAEDAIRHRVDIGETEKEQLIRARRGQGRFRQELEVWEAGCRLTQVTDRAHLRASHIKPWSKSNDSEKLDPNNGLLLSPHIDHLFDRGYISFADNGDLVISKYLEPSILATWGLKSQVNVGKFRASQCVYLDFHRKHVFQK